MCYAFLDSVLNNGAASVTLLVRDAQAGGRARTPRAARRRGGSRTAPSTSGTRTSNLRFKLPNLAALNYPFLYVDADTFVLDSLLPLWERRHDKPWIGSITSGCRTTRGRTADPFLNSGVQLVGDPDFYDLAAILAAQNAVVPLALHATVPKREMFATPGQDQAVLFRYFPRDRLRTTLIRRSARSGTVAPGLRTFGAKAHAGAGTLAG